LSEEIEADHLQRRYRDIAAAVRGDDEALGAKLLD
jgi:hypothetical protein